MWFMVSITKMEKLFIQNVYNLKGFDYKNFYYLPNLTKYLFNSKISNKTNNRSGLACQV